MLRHQCVIAAALGVFAVLIVGDRRMAAQAGPPTASVSVRRLTSLTSRVVTGDFNGDGIVDLASTSATPTAPRPIVVALGRGDSTFNTPRSAGIGGGVLAAGDFNNDGKLDLIAADDSDDAPLRLLPGNGDGTFAAPVKIGGAVVRSLPFGLVADFNGDGNLDVAVGYRGESDDDGVLIYQGYGDGTFSDLISRLDTGTSSFPAGAVVADLNNDGKPDVLVANHLAKSLSIFLNQGGFNFTASDRQMQWAANDVTAADVNGDGNVDVIVAEAFSADGDVSYRIGSVFVYLGNGDGTIADFGHVYSMGHGAWRVAMQYRSTTNGTSASAVQVSGAAPVWLRIRRSESAPPGGPTTFSASYSTDLNLWRLLSNSINFTMSHDSLIGIAVTSHKPGVKTQVVLDDIRIER